MGGFESAIIKRAYYYNSTEEDKDTGVLHEVDRLRVADFISSQLDTIIQTIQTIETPKNCPAGIMAVVDMLDSLLKVSEVVANRVLERMIPLWLVLMNVFPHNSYIHSKIMMMFLYAIEQESLQLIVVTNKELFEFAKSNCIDYNQRQVPAGVNLSWSCFARLLVEQCYEKARMLDVQDLDVQDWESEYYSKTIECQKLEEKKETIVLSRFLFSFIHSLIHSFTNSLIH